MKVQGATAGGDPPSPMFRTAPDEDGPRARTIAAWSGDLAAGDLLRDPGAGASGRADERRGAFRLGWAASLALNLCLLAAPFALVIALPPVMACRERAEQFGFFAGETLAGCSIQGVRDRVRKLEDRIKMLVRDSGR